MALPQNVNKEPVHGTWINMDGTPAVGSVKLAARVKGFLADAAADVSIIPGPFTIPVDSEGQLSEPVPCTDDPDLAPNGFTYLVTEQFTTGSRTYEIEVPVGSGGVDLVTVAPVQPVTASVRLVRTVNGVKPDSTGDVSLSAADVGALPSAPNGIGMASVLVLSASGTVPPGTPAGTVILRRSA